MDTGIIAGKVASAVSHSVELPMTAGLDSYLSSETIAVAAAAQE